MKKNKTTRSKQKSPPVKTLDKKSMVAAKGGYLNFQFKLVAVKTLS